MKVSFHRFTGFGFTSRSLDCNPGTKVARDARDALVHSLAALDTLGEDGGGISRGYDPRELPVEGCPGYRWLIDRIDELVRGRPKFDGDPVVGDMPADKRREPFSALSWKVAGKPREALTEVCLEVLCGHDFVLFHQFGIFDLLPGNRQQIEQYKAIAESMDFLKMPCSSEAFLTGSFLQIANDDPELVPRDLLVPDRKLTDCCWSAGGQPFRVRWDLSASGVASPRNYQGFVLLTPVPSDESRLPGRISRSRESKHAIEFDGAMGFLIDLSTLMVDDAKVEFEYEQASSPDFANLEHRLSVQTVRARQRLARQKQFLGTCLSQSDVDDLEVAEIRIGKQLTRFEELVTTCEIDAHQFTKFSHELAIEDNAWIKRTILRHGMLNWNLLSLQRRLGSHFRFYARLADAVRSAEKRSASLCYAPELIRFWQATTAGSTGQHQGDFSKVLVPLVECTERTDGQAIAPTTFWKIPLPAAEQGSKAVPERNAVEFTVLRPQLLEPQGLDNLTDHYAAALRNCPPGQFLRLIDDLLSQGSTIHLSNEIDDPRHVAPLRIDLLFPDGCLGTAPQVANVKEKLWHPGDEEADKENNGKKNKFCSFHQIYMSLDPAKSGAVDPPTEIQNLNQQHWVAMMSLLSLLDGLARVLRRPPQQHAVVLGGNRGYLVRFLVLAGVLRAIAGHRELAKARLREAVDAAMESDDFAWALCAAQLAQVYEQWDDGHPDRRSLPGAKTNRRETEQRHAWRRDLTSAFLKVFDLPSAVAIARVRTGPDDAPFAPRSLRISWCLRAPALFLMVLMLMPAMIRPGLEPVQGSQVKAPVTAAVKARDVADLIEVPTAAQRTLAYTTLAAGVVLLPLAILAGAWGSLRGLSLQILYPQLFGAITIALVAFLSGLDTIHALCEASSLAKGILIVVSLAGAWGYLSWEIIHFYPWRASLGRVLDLMSLAFLEACLLGSLFVAVFGAELSSLPGSAWWIYAQPGSDGVLFYASPLNTLMVASCFLFIGIVIRLMFEPAKLGLRTAADLAAQ